MKLFLSSLLLVGAATAFTIDKVVPQVVKVTEGGSIRVICTTSDWYEVRQMNLFEIYERFLSLLLLQPIALYYRSFIAGQ